MQKIGIVGSGLMGSGIAQVTAQSGVEVLLADQDSDSLDRALAQIGKRLARLGEQGKLNEDIDVIQERIQASSDLDRMAEADLVIEAVSEKESLKRSLFEQLDALCPPSTVLASNTSSISITNIASATKRPDRVVGIHFFNPVPLMPLVEIIRGAATSDETSAAVTRFAEHLGKTVIHAKDSPGFVVNRILIPFLIEAIFALESGVASREDIDKGVTLGLGHPMGPLTLADFVGLDTLLSICEVYQREFGDPKYRPPVLLRRYVAAGWLGRKSGKGFYEYPNGNA